LANIFAEYARVGAYAAGVPLAVCHPAIAADHHEWICQCCPHRLFRILEDHDPASLLAIALEGFFVQALAGRNPQ
jgi:hypothetical protein